MSLDIAGQRFSRRSSLRRPFLLRTVDCRLSTVDFPGGIGDHAADFRERTNDMEKPIFPGWPQLDQDDYDAVKSVLDSRALWCGAPLAPCGNQVWRFQEEFARFQGVRRALAVTNGTHAIEASLLALGIGLGDEVIVTDYTFVASASAVLAVN